MTFRQCWSDHVDIVNDAAIGITSSHRHKVRAMAVQDCCRPVTTDVVIMSFSSAPLVILMRIKCIYKHRCDRRPAPISLLLTQGRG